MNTTELKTLKDFEDDFICSSCLKKLKAEAVKWYKSNQTPKNTKDWIEMFFNLAEEDLKEEKQK